MTRKHNNIQMVDELNLRPRKCLGWKHFVKSLLGNSGT